MNASSRRQVLAHLSPWRLGEVVAVGVLEVIRNRWRA
jgi:hypothetical protein